MSMLLQWLSLHFDLVGNIFQLQTQLKFQMNISPATYQTPSFTPSYQSRHSVPSFSSNGSCETCNHYQQDIAILQQKLMETHNKLIQQIDINKQKQIQILNLTKQMDQLILKKGVPNHEIEYFIESNNQLKNDLESMRNKMLAEIKKSNQMKDMLSEKQREVLQLSQAIKNVGKSQHKCQCGYQEKYQKLDEAFMNQRTLTNQLIQQNSQLQQKLYQLKISPIHPINMHQPNKKPFSQNIKKDQKKTVSHKHKHNKQNKHSTFKSTIEFIQQLDAAEQQIRNKK